MQIISGKRLRQFLKTDFTVSDWATICKNPLKSNPLWPRHGNSPNQVKTMLENSLLTVIWPEYGRNCLSPNSKTGFYTLVVQTIL